MTPTFHPLCPACRWGRKHSQSRHEAHIEMRTYLKESISRLRFDRAGFNRDLMLAHIAFLEIDLATMPANPDYTGDPSQANLLRRVPFHLAQFDAALERAFGR